MLSLPPRTQEKSDKEATPNATPTQNRKTKRRSNLFTRKDSGSQQSQQQQPQPPLEEPPPLPSQQQQLSASGRGALGSGRAIPVKQGCLYKKTVNALNREWKKKYVTLSEDGKLTYHPNLHDYMENSHGKDIELSRTTVKIPGQLRPTSNGLLKSHHQPSSLATSGGGVGGSAADPNQAGKKRRHRRAKSGNRGAVGVGGGGGGDPDVDESDGYEFMIVSLRTGRGTSRPRARRSGTSGSAPSSTRSCAASRDLPARP